MKEIFLSGNEKKELYTNARRHVTRKRTRTGALLHGLHIAFCASNLIGKGNCYSFSDLICEAEQKFIWNEYNWKKYQLERMKRRGLIQTKETHKGIDVILTSRGYSHSLKEMIASNTNELPENVWCVVTYDIPEYSKKERNRFRKMLKRSGFTMLQRSVWAIRHDVTSLMCKYIEDTNMTEWVNIFTASIVAEKRDRAFLQNTDGKHQ